MIRPPPRSTLFPYTTLCLSLLDRQPRLPAQRPDARAVQADQRGVARPSARPAGVLDLRVDLERAADRRHGVVDDQDRKSTRLNFSHANISYAVFCLNRNQKS